MPADEAVATRAADDTATSTRTEEGGTAPESHVPAHEEGQDRAETVVNRWDAMRSEISKLSAPPEAATETPSREAEAPPPARSTAEEATEAQTTGEEGERAQHGEQEPRNEEAKTERGPSRYTIVDGEGTEYEFEPLPPGAKLTFRMDGRDVAVRSLDELVDLAQKGAVLPRVEANLQRQRDQALRQARSLEQKLAAADQRFREIVEDVEKYKAYRARAKRLLDPDYREGIEAKRKLEAREAEDAERAEQEQAQVVEEFWGEVQKYYHNRLPHYEHLEPEDYPTIVRDYWSAFQAHRHALYQELQPVAEQQGVSQQELEAIVDQQAIAWLTEDNFEAQMRALNDRIGRRIGKGNGKPGASREEEDLKAAKRHNEHVETKVRQRDETKMLRNRGAAPGPASERQERPRTWDGHMAAIREEFERAKQSSVEE